MDAWDPARKIGLIVDEWGTWHPVEKGTNPAFLYQQNTIRDAIVAANTLDIFNRHADKVVMANIAQTINVLQAMILTEGEQMLVTPTGYVYEMYAPHQGATALRTRIETPDINFKKSNILQTSWQSALQKDETMEGSIPLVAGSASLKGKELFLTITNSHAREASGSHHRHPGRGKSQWGSRTDSGRRNPCPQHLQLAHPGNPAGIGCELRGLSAQSDPLSGVSCCHLDPVGLKTIIGYLPVR